MNYIIHFNFNLIVSIKCLIMAFFHLIHGLIPTVYTSHDYWIKKEIFMKENNVLPCPFCGSNNLEIYTSNEDREGIPHGIICSDCGGSSGFSYMKTNTTDIYIVSESSEWNKRCG